MLGSSEAKIKTQASRAPITAWASKSGEFNRMQSQFRHAISNQPGAEFPAQKGRYHLYVSYACPWAHRALIVRKLKGLEEILPYTIVHWEMLEKGWRFYTAEEREAQSGILASLKSSQSQPSNDEKNKDVEREKTKLAVIEEEVQHLSPDPSHQHHTHLRHLYLEEDPQYDGRFTVPLLYDIQQKKIVSNEVSVPDSISFLLPFSLPLDRGLLSPLLCISTFSLLTLPRHKLIRMTVTV